MQGVWIDYRRPKSKKEVRETLASDPSRVGVEATSWLGDEYDGPILDAPRGKTIYFVGPDPYKKRNFYGQLKWSEKEEKWIVPK